MSDTGGTYSQLIEMSREKAGRPTGPPAERTTGRRASGPNEPLAKRPKEGPAGPTKRPAASSSGSRQPRPKRTVRHRSYDFFSDQVSWLNRAKLEINEQYGLQIPATAMVQLAVDLLIRDFETNGEGSELVRVLVRGEPLAPPDTKDDGERR